MLGFAFIFSLTTAAFAAIEPLPTLELSKDEDRIRVRIFAKKKWLSLRGLDLRFYQIKKGDQDWSLSHRTQDRTKWTLTCRDRQITLKKVGTKKVHYLRTPLSVRSQTGFLNLNGKFIREELRLYPERGSCMVLNVLNIEKYLDGLVNAEFSSKWSPEAVKAQTVAARTYAYFKIREAQRVNRKFDLTSDIKDQAYAGFGGEDYMASKLVYRTKGLVLVGRRKPKEPIKAFYHSTCGGKTEMPDNVWSGGQVGYKKSVRCRFCHPSPAYRWTLEMDAEEIRDVMVRHREFAPVSWPKNWLSQVSLASLDGVFLHGFNSTGRVSDLRFNFSLPDGRDFNLPLSATQFRSWVGTRKLKSTRFAIGTHRFKGDSQFVFKGKGNGHGVGLCQWGAKTMAEKGYKMREILKHYYPQARLKRLRSAL